MHKTGGKSPRGLACSLWPTQQDVHQTLISINQIGWKLDMYMYVVHRSFMYHLISFKLNIDTLTLLNHQSIARNR